ncbi:RNA 2',3'-cyclic phosphodiesterase [Panacagrimonas perspica]|nr:RNA 2',3'-cyclic phosphodiesterase [Panacagrimonas perspica]
MVPNRLFFALLPDAATREAMTLAAKSIALKLAHGGREVPEANLHLTLMFLGDAVPAQDEQAACGAAESVSSDPFTFALDAAGSFPTAWWLGQHKASPELQRLRKSLQTAITTRKVAYDRQHFVPHVTIARHPKTRLATTSIAPVEWRCDSFSLMRSSLAGQGVAYEQIARWSLRSRVEATAAQMSLI